ncbi:uncharacterized protein LOC132783926 isoform X1 [Drosophila nasuta]|uniref:uncharacterized protein LOC132783926 isoform X1 n=1 Tax=Drosophila nasuta TaxID=42062 RepID=UPI00295EE761|nr:uncharacterized protein LOC132783926 isoform X1 [Drosophila nasuta]
MSNARELALIEKWADIATPPTPTLPTSLSPTSPSTIIKFCCCPQRRRYTLKQPKYKSTANTLHARNIFVDNDFTYIDDVPRANNKSNNKSNSSNSNFSNKRRQDCDSDYDCNDYDDAVDDDEANDIAEISGGNDGNVALILMNQRNVPEQWRQDNKGSSNSSSSNSNKRNSSELAAATATQSKTCAVTNSQQSGNEQQQQQQPIQRLSNSLQQQQQQHSNKENTLSNTKSNHSNCSSNNNKSNYNKPRCNYCKLPDDAEPQTNNTNSNANVNTNTNTNSKIDSPKSSQNKMTITTAATTTNIAATATASECGLTLAAATATAEELVGAATEVLCSDKPTLTATSMLSTPTPPTATTPTATTPKPSIAARPTTPSRLKTVIKTTMVKRSPSHDSTAPATAAMQHMLQPNSCNTSNQHDEPRRSVRERIAAFAAGNEQQQQQPSGGNTARQHDSAKKFSKIQCNTNQNNMTSDVKSAISGGSNTSNQQQHQTLINGNGNSSSSNATPPSPAATTAGNTSVCSATIATDTTRYKSGLSDVVADEDVDDTATSTSTAKATASATATAAPSTPAATTSMATATPAAAASVFSTGCATMPRTRQYGSNAAGAAATATAAANAVTADKKFLSLAPAATQQQQQQHVHHKLQLVDKPESQLAALNNLDLAHRFDLIDDDAEDPYGPLEDYLERVKLEINEVFELRKAQRLHQQLMDQLDAARQAAAATEQLDELSRSTESDSGFDSSSTTATTTAAATATTTATATSKPVTTKLRALPPPPLSPAEQPSRRPSTTANTASQPDDVNIWANKFLRDLDNLMGGDKVPPHLAGATGNSPTSRTAPMLLSAAASAALQSRLGKSTANTANGEQQQQNGLVLKPEKHATIPLQSFNLDCGRTEATPTAASRPSVAYMRTLSAPGGQVAAMPSRNASIGGPSQRKSLALSAFNGHAETSSSSSLPSSATTHKLTNFQSALKIEELTAATGEAATTTTTATTTTMDDLKSRRQLETATMPMPKRVGINLATTSPTLTSRNVITPPPPASAKQTAAASASASAGTHLTSGKGAATPGYLVDVTKKGSTSTIWTSEESILRSVGAVDEDNNSTSSSSACEEAAGVLSSGKSGISLDSSGLDNDNNESGIGTATPPKDMSYWKSHHLQHHHLHHHHHHHHRTGGSSAPDNESVSSLEALRKMKFQKSGSVASSDDPDLLEVLSLCGSGGEAANESQDDMLDDQGGKQLPDKAAAGEYDECQDEFELPQHYYDCDCTDGDASSASGGGGTASITTPVVLRRKYSAAPPIMVPLPSVPRRNLRSLSLDHHQPHQQFLLQPRKLLARHNHKERAQLSLTLRQEPFQSLLSPNATNVTQLHHFVELPSPSSASLHSDTGGIQELTTKSNSAPLLLKEREHSRRCDDFAAQHLTLRYSRSQSDRYLAEIEAVEACKWLRAAGFPQYAQMYEDHQFPIELNNVAKDHTNLENDQLQSLYRRLCVLNRCANMRLDQSHKPQTPQQKEESDDENFALSENWTFQPHIRRWSRIGEMGLELPPPGHLNLEKTESSSKESSPDRFEDDSYDLGGAGITLMIPGCSKGDPNDPNSLHDGSDGSAATRLRRTGSERFKDGAKAFLRRVESIKSRRRKRQNRENVVISGPQVLDLAQLGQRSSLRKPDAVYSTPPSPSALSPIHTFPKAPFFGNELKVPSHSENFLSPNRASPKRTPTTPRSMRTSPLHFFSSPMTQLKEGKSDDSSSYYSDSQESSTGGKLSLSLRKPSKARRFLQRSGKVDDIGAHSDSECHQGRKLLIKDANSNTTEVKIKKLTRGGSLNLGKDAKKRDGFRSSSFRSRSTSRKEPKNEEEHGSSSAKRQPVVRYHSFQMEERPNMIFRKCFSQKIEPQAQQEDAGIPFAAMSAGQLQIIRKLALVTLTGHMERYCPTHRSGWNWELPKFIKKIKMPDYKDKKVFGVPLLLILQRSGQTLPLAVRAALRWLQLNALDQVGLFRKSGGKSRIMKLREQIEVTESTAECMDVFDLQQAYDVADMLKQYFRELPESLLTTKMSETFVAIFQHLPAEVRLDAVQCAVLLLPDENREILYVLLEFLTIVAANSAQNQMTSNNLGVCLAQSIFHSSISTGSASVSASPRRKGKGSGMPDMKELAEAKASHECLSFMIDHYKPIYTAAKEKLGKCNFGYMEESKPVPLEALGEGMQFHNWRGYLYECTSATIKEGREKTRGWFTISSLNDSNVDISYKKVGDGHPLRLWRCSTEIEGPPREVLEYIIKQRASWDPNLLQCQTVKKLDDRTEIYQYALDGQLTTDFCVLRSWQTDLPRGACVIVETSIDHAKAKPLFCAVRGVVLASRYLIEPCGSGRSRVMHLARVDVKGKTPEWYNKNYGHICSHYLSRIRLAFKHVADGPESKV